MLRPVRASKSLGRKHGLALMFFSRFVLKLLIQLRVPRLTRINQQRQERPRYLSTDQPDTRSRSLLSRSRVNRAVEAARRVGGGLIVAARSVGMRQRRALVVQAEGMSAEAAPVAPRVVPVV